MGDAVQPVTREDIFGPEDDIDNETSVSNAAEIGSVTNSSSKKSLGQPSKQTRVRLTIAQKMQVHRFHAANPQMSYQQLAQWCLKQFRLDKAPDKSTVCTWLKKSDAATSQRAKIEKAIEAESNPLKLNAKSFQGSYYPELEHRLFAWFRRCETRHAAITDDIITE